MLNHETVTIAGASGTAYTDRPATGYLEYISVTYTNGAIAGDVTITDEAEGTALLTLTDNNTDFGAPIRVQVTGITGSTIAANYARIPVTGRIKVVTAQEAANTTVVVVLYWSDN